jgi:hypothetical protein
MMLFPASFARDLHLEVFFESAPDQIHRPDLKVTLNHYAFFQASVVIKNGVSHLSVPSRAAYSAPPSGYAVT